MTTALPPQAYILLKMAGLSLSFELVREIRPVLCERDVLDTHLAVGKCGFILRFQRQGATLADAVFDRQTEEFSAKIR